MALASTHKSVQPKAERIYNDIITKYSDAKPRKQDFTVQLGDHSKPHSYIAFNLKELDSEMETRSLRQILGQLGVQPYKEVLKAFQRVKTMKIRLRVKARVSHDNRTTDVFASSFPRLVTKGKYSEGYQ
jgi:hypothetical protein